MKPVCYLLLLVFISGLGCNPKDVTSPAPLVITYELQASANAAAQFNVTYNSASGPKTVTASHGWLQPVTVDTRPFVASVTAVINTNVSFPFTIRILYNGAPRKENTGTTVPGANTTLSVSETFN